MNLTMHGERSKFISMELEKGCVINLDYYFYGVINCFNGDFTYKPQTTQLTS